MVHWLYKIQLSINQYLTALHFTVMSVFTLCLCAYFKIIETIYQCSFLSVVQYDLLKLPLSSLLLALFSYWLQINWLSMLLFFSPYDQANKTRHHFEGAESHCACADFNESCYKRRTLPPSGKSCSVPAGRCCCHISEAKSTDSERHRLSSTLLSTVLWQSETLFLRIWNAHMEWVC